MTTTQRSLIGITIAAIIGIATLASLPHSSAAPKATPTATQAVTDGHVSTVLAPPVSIAPVAVQRVSKAPSKHPQAPSRSRSTTTTSEVPPPLTAEQEAKIPGPGEEGEARYNDPDHFEHMPATDYNLPSEDVTSGVTRP